MTDHGRKEFHVYTGSPTDQEVLEALRHQAFYSGPAPTPSADVHSDAHDQAMFFKGLGMQPVVVSLGDELAAIERRMEA